MVCQSVTRSHLKEKTRTRKKISTKDADENGVHFVLAKKAIYIRRHLSRHLLERRRKNLYEFFIK